MEDIFDLFSELFPQLIVYLFKTVWCLLLYLVSFGTIPFSVSWESKALGRLGLVCLTLLLIGIILYFTFRGSYYFNS